MVVDYYQLLNVEPNARAEDIHHAYRALAMRYHPDRNSSSGAAFTMTAINDAYSVLSDPVRRRKYDQQRNVAQGRDIATPVLRAARETLLKQGWTLTHDDGTGLTLERDSRRVRVCFVDRLTNVKLRSIGRRSSAFSVVLAVEIETPINLSLQTAVIDLMHSSHHGPGFPDEAYRSLFQAFL